MWNRGAEQVLCGGQVRNDNLCPRSQSAGGGQGWSFAPSAAVAAEMACAQWGSEREQ